MVNNDDEIKKAEDKFIEGINSIGSIWGIGAVESKIIGYLYTQNQPTSLNVLTDCLKISKGNISVAIRKLEEKGIVKNIWVKGDRKDYYEITMDIWQILLKKLVENYKNEANAGIETINATIPLIQASFGKLSDQATDKARNLMQKLQKLKTYYILADEIGKTLEQSTIFSDQSKVRLLWSGMKAQLKTIK